MNNPDSYDILGASIVGMLTAAVLWAALNGRLEDAAAAVVIFARL